MDSQIVSSTSIEPNAYTDISGLNRLKRAAVTEDPGAIKAVAKQFEALFINMMMKSMRQANEVFGEDNPFKSSEAKFFQEILDKEYGLTMAGAGGIGLAEIIEKQLLGHRSPDIAARPTVPHASLNSSVNKANAVSDMKLLPVEGAQGTPTQPLNLLNRAEEVEKAGSKNRGETFPNEAVSQALSVRPRPSHDQTPLQSNTVQLDSELTDAKIDTQPPQFGSPQEFVEALWGLAKSAATALSVDPRILMAQAALETGWGQHTLKDANGGSSFNLFNIKAGADWEGKSVVKNALEYEQGIAVKRQSSFRAYHSFEESFNDYIQFIQSSPRYQKALSLVNKPLEYVEELQKAGYATDPEYGAKVGRIFNSDIFK